MRQIGLVPAGCQLAFTGGVFAGPGYVCYASSVAIYFLDPQNFSILKIIAYNSRAICCFSVDPNDHNRMVVGSMDGTLTAWDIETEQISSKVTIGINIRTFADWDRFTPDTVVVALNNPNMQVYTWKTTTNEEEPARLVPARTMSGSKLVTALKCSPHTKGQFGIGCEDGGVIVESATGERKRKILSPASGTDSGEVADLQWDKKSSLYLLVAYARSISLWDIESGSTAYTFDKQGGGISVMAWMDWTAGNFVSCNRRTGILKVWNVSQRQALDSVKIPCSGGILGVSFAPGSTAANCCCSDGSVVSYDFIRREVVNSTVGGHTDTVFDCCFSPFDPNIFTTCSFDGTLKVWNCTELTLLQTFSDANSIFYSCAWSPCGKLLACTTIKGEVLLWNLETGRAVVKYTHHTKASYSVRWNSFPTHSNKLCSTSADGSAVVFEIPLERFSDARSGAGVLLGSSKKKNNIQEDTNVLCRINTSSAAFGCSWCPTAPNIVCVGYADSMVRVYDYSTASSNPTPIFVLNGHSERVFSCSWSPLVPGLLATGSDDTTIVIWQLGSDFASVASIPSEAASAFGNVAKTLGIQERCHTSGIIPYKILKGHKSNVRALSWNFEHVDVLQSGSWDSSIKIWNAATGVCIQNVPGHLLDVYTVTSHPKRPFTYVSTSRDTTIRVWEMEGIFSKMRIRAMLEFSIDRYISNEKTSEKIPSDKLEDGSADSSCSNHDMDWSGSISSVLRGSHSKKLASLLRTTKANVYARAGCEAGQSPFWELCCANDESKIEVIEAIKDIVSFFCGSNGSVQMWSAVKQVIDKNDNSGSTSASSTAFSKSGSFLHGTISTNPPVVMENKILGIARSEAMQAESLIPSSKRNRESDLDPKHKDLLKAAALAYLKAGDFVKYCEILVELGEWLEAIAFAPCISREFWEGLTLRYAEKQTTERTAAAGIPYFVAVGHDFSAIRSCVQSRDYRNAMILAKMSSERLDVISASAGNNVVVDLMSSKNGLSELFMSARSATTSCRERTETEDEKYRNITREILKHSITDSWNKSFIFEAATQCFVVGDALAAYELLTLAGEFDMGQVLRMCFGMPVDKEVIRNIAIRLVFLGDLSFAVKVVSHFFPRQTLERTRAAVDERSPRDRKFAPKVEPVTEIDIECGLLISRHRKSRNPIDKGELLQKYSLPPLHVWLQLAVEMEAVGDDADALGCFSVCGDIVQAIRIVLDSLKKYVGPSNRKEKLCLHPAAAKVYSRAKQIIASEIVDISERSLFLCYMCWLGAHQALYNGFCNIAWKMLSVMKSSVDSLVKFPLSSFDVECQELVIRLENHEENAHQLLMNMCSVSELAIKAGEALEVKAGLIALQNCVLSNCSCKWCVASKNSLGNRNEEALWRVSKSIEFERFKAALSLPMVPEFQECEETEETINISGLSAERVGSLLPQANHKLQKQLSCVTREYIRGAFVTLPDGVSTVSVNDAASWIKFNPFSPAMDGTFVEMM